MITAYELKLEAIKMKKKKTGTIVYLRLSECKWIFNEIKSRWMNTAYDSGWI